MRFFRRSQSQSQSNQAVIVVSGLPRSGTSLMMQMLEAAGVAVLSDSHRPADTHNPRGYYEFERVKALHRGDKAWVPLARGKAVKVVSVLLEHLPADHQYQVVFMRRDLGEVLRSQDSMLNQEGQSLSVNPAMLRRDYERHLASMDRWLRMQKHISFMYVEHRHLIEAPDAQVERLGQFLGLPGQSQAMVDVVDRGLYRQRTKSIE